MRSTVLLIATAITGLSATIEDHRPAAAHATPAAVPTLSTLAPVPRAQPVPAAHSAPQAEAVFQEPPVAPSHAGVLSLSLTTAASTVSVAGREVMLMAYNARYIAPTLRVRPGDTIRLKLANGLDQPTNLHTHGLVVSPQGHSDNPFLHIAPGETVDYEIRLPADHPPGLYWYHPHPHGFSDVQTRNGMSGALIVEGLLDPFPTLRHVRERLLLLKDVQLRDGRVAQLGIGQGAIRTINGVANPVIVLRPGETQLWRIGNIGADLYYRLILDGHQFQVVARDGHRRARLVPRDTLMLSPGARVEVLVTGGTPGEYHLRTDDIDTGPAGNQYAGGVMATVRVQGPPASRVVAPPALLAVEDLRGKVTNRRTIVYTESKDGNTLFIDGKTFDMSRTDTRVRLGAVEEWTIRNESDELHTFHIHQAPFQLTEINGVAQPADDHRDIIDVPIRGEVKVVIPFTNPLIVGRFVYHCHILSHEDKGMMATIEVAP
jgi:FtsP/CotA-like multicopper oxidase with cupredoxin domain